MSQFLIDALANLSTSTVMEEVGALSARNGRPLEILAILQEGMNQVGVRFERGEIAVSDVIAASQIFQEALDLLGLGTGPARASRLGSWVIGTVYDGHDIGKNLVRTALSVAGFRTFDLGVRVTATQFVRAVKQHHPKFVGMSCLSFQGFGEMKACITAIRLADPTRQLRIVIGGAACEESTAAFVGADIYCRTPREAVNYGKALRSKWTVISAAPGHSPIP